jgi:hypothetical protein
LMHTRLRTVAPSSLTRLRRSVQKKVIRALALLPERP